MSKTIPELDYLHADPPAYLERAKMSKAMMRLQDVGMHCGLEYTSFPYFKGVGEYSRYAHSVGVAEIIAHFGGDKKQVLAGLYHDIATPTFAHVIDFLKGDSLKQEATEEGTRAIIEGDKEIQMLLKKEGLTSDDVADYHRYPIADNDSPKLSADRLEYTLANFLHFHFAELPEVQALYDDLTLGKNEDGEDEIMFSSLAKAHRFGMLMIQNSIMYSRAEDRYAMATLAKVLQMYLDGHVLEESDFLSTESKLLKKIGDSGKAAPWLMFHRLYKVVPGDDYDRHAPGYLYTDDIQTKKRYIDPLVKGKGRLSTIDPEFKELLDVFLSIDMSVKLSGYTK